MTISVRELKGIGEKTEKLLARLNIKTVDQLVHHYPRCYTTYPDPISIREIRQGVRCTVEGALDSPVHMSAGRRVKILTALISDQSGSLFLRWFNMPYLRSTLHQGERYLFTGTPIFKDGRIKMEHPEVLTPQKYEKLKKTYQPIYPLTSGLSNQTIKKAQIQAFNVYHPQEFLPENVQAYYNLEDEEKALSEIHFPHQKETLIEARRRIIFDEFFRFFAALELVKEHEHKALNHYIIHDDDRVSDFMKSLPYDLTGAQKKTLLEIRSDLAGTRAMNRLVQGDVGSGKTIVAMIAMYQVVLNGYQAVLMAPTEVLASQHYASFTKMLGPLGVRIGLLTGALKASDKKKVKNQCRQGDIDILIGTHAVIEEDVEFPDLALAVTDEQHRFGVHQRDALMKKGRDPHVLVMSATPIPRTLGIILYRDLDISIMDELPASRKPI